MAESGAFSVGLTAKSRTGSADTNGGSGYLVKRACLYGFTFVSGNQNGTRQHALFATIAVPYVPHPPTFREEPKRKEPSFKPFTGNRMAPNSLGERDGTRTRDLRRDRPAR